MTTEHTVQMVLTLEPVQTPWVQVSVGNHNHRQQLTQPTDFSFVFDWPQGACSLVVEHFDKTAQDAVTAVIVKRIELFGISDPKFVWAGVYRPNYPEPWFSQQTIVPPAVLPQHNYLGWNGQWQLDFTVPVFVWMHRTLGLGWLYQ